MRKRINAASHPNATAELLAALASDASRNVRRIVAGRPETPSVALQALAADPDRATREAVAANPGTPPDALISLLSDSTWQVRLSVVTNPAADPRVRRAMCASAEQDVRLVLAQQPGLPAEIGALLAQDPDPEVRQMLAEQTDDAAILQTLLNDPDPHVRGAAGINEGTTTAQRRQLVHDPVAYVRASVVHAMASHGWDIPQEDLLLLARDRSVNVRYWVASLPGFTRPVYEILAQDPDEMTATAARAWLMAPDDPAFAGNLPNEVEVVLGGLDVQGQFANPAQLGRPTPRLRPANISGHHTSG